MYCYLQLHPTSRLRSVSLLPSFLPSFLLSRLLALLRRCLVKCLARRRGGRGTKPRESPRIKEKKKKIEAARQMREQLAHCATLNFIEHV